MAESAVYEGKCLCGGIRIEVVGEPAGAGLCHCETCRTWHAAPVNAFATWGNEAITVTQGEDLLVGYDSGTCFRHWCRKCGSGLLNRLRGGELTAVYVMVLGAAGYLHRPSCHIYCEESVFDIQDGLPKYLDLPSEWGGSGERLEEPTRSGIREG